MSESTEERLSFDSVEKPLLDYVPLEITSPTRPSSLLRLSFFALAQLILIAIYSAAFLGLHHGRVYPSEASRGLVYSPARSAVVPEVQKIKASLDEKNAFNGPPNPEQDAAWMSLFDYANIRVTQEELRPTNRTSVLLNDRSGDAFGVLDVFHQLHCVKYIHEYVHQDYYNLKPTGVDPRDHVDHCIDMVRQLVMCKADVSLMTFSWLPDSAMPWPNFEIEHDCRNWDSIIEWSKERAINVSDFSLLVHPTLGPSFDEPDWNRTKASPNR